MDSRGHIHHFDEPLTVDEIRYRGLEPIPDNQLAAIMAMPRKERRAWFTKQKRLQKKARRKAGGQ